jgi:hypothetical protein
MNTAVSITTQHFNPSNQQNAFEMDTNLRDVHCVNEETGNAANGGADLDTVSKPLALCCTK